VRAGRVVIGSDVGKARGQAPPPPARLAFRADQPAAQLDRLLAGKRCAEGGIGGIEQVMALVEHDPRSAAARSRGLGQR
jgi:hypothetical protein